MEVNMTFDEQVKKAKGQKLENRIVRDVVFILLGLIFFIVSIVMAYNDSKKDTKKNKTTTKVTTTIKEN